MRALGLLFCVPVAVVAFACGGSGGGGSGGGDDGGASSSSGGSSSGSGSSSGTSSSSGSSSGTSSSSGSSSGTSSSSGSSSGSASSSGGQGEAGACGTCPSGFSCGSGGYCVNAHGVPAFDHVYLIMMENTSQSAIQGSSKAPYINSLMTTYGYTKNYSTTYHPSLPNYLDVTSGTNQGIKCDCDADSTETKCGAVCLGGCYCPISGQHLGDELDGASVTWREYSEGAGGPCATKNNNAAHYATKHVPFLYYTDLASNSATCQDRVRDYGDLAGDLAAGPRRFNMISPNLCDDMHDSCAPTNNGIAQGDAWLGTEVPKLLATPGFQAGGKDVLFIVWDEQTGSTGGAGTPMLCIAVGPLVKPGSTSSQAYTHESLLATFEDTFGVVRLNNAAQVPSPINDLWK
ncbi:MAG: alkaline phosphatase family protein [Polyangiaceae bacterium]